MTIKVPAGFQTWFGTGEPPVASFTQETVVTITGEWSNSWLRADNVPGFPKGRPVLFLKDDIGEGKTLQVVQP